MGGDYSRQRFEPGSHFAGVLMQQGRVQLDSDWNEQVRILDRRSRAETVDLVSFGPNPGLFGVAVVPRQTPNAFKITAGGGGGLTIGRGRMYVDGLLAENHGDLAGALEFDRLLDELRGVSDTPYNKQPYHPKVVAVPSSGSVLVYLDIWQREIGYLESPGIVESAVAVDTTTRLQTVWQVRVLPNIGSGVTCATPDAQVPGWLALTAPSAGRLTTRAVGVAADAEPCELPPVGGYRGLENQLYRVEIHQGGATGTATFKWSRDNATVAARVEEIVSNHELRLDSFGRDSVLRINTNDWVEIVDDWRELSGVGGDPAQRRGEIRRVTVNEDSGTITFTPNLPADLIPAGTGDDTLAKRHLRVRRWDQHGKVARSDGTVHVDLDATGSTGAIPVPAAGVKLALEAGIEVEFSVEGAGGTFRTGDYWLFAARTADASVEDLTDAPPLGVHHHFARLAVGTLPGTPADCRTMWPPEAGEGGCCDCTVCVTPEQQAQDPDALQKAVSFAGKTGGTVCLTVGTYQLPEAVIIEKLASLEIHGRGHKTELVAPKGAFRIDTALQVSIRDLQIHAVEPALRVRASAAVTLERLWIDLESDFAAITLGGLLLEFALKECIIRAATGVAIDTSDEKNTELTVAGLLVRDNQLECRDRCIDLTDARHLGQTVIEGNLLTQAQDVAVSVTGLSIPEGTVSVLSNMISATGDAIVTGSQALHIEGNEISGHDKEPGGYGILVRDDDSYQVPVNGLRILNNRIHNRRRAGIAIQAPIGAGMIKNNTIDDAAAGIVFEENGQAETLSIENNHIFDINGDPDDKEVAAVGIRVSNTRLASIVTNTVRGVGMAPVMEAGRVGIQLLGCQDIRVTGNDVSQIGPDAEFGGPAVGIHVLSPFVSVNLTDNIVVRDLRDNPDPFGNWSGILIADGQQGDGKPIKLSKDMLTFDAGDERVFVINRAVIFAGKIAERVDLRGNTVRGSSSDSITIIQTAGECQLANNRWEQIGGKPAVNVSAAFAIVSANRATGGEISLLLNVDPKKSTVIGNITSTPINMHGALTAPWAPLNVIA